MSIEDIDFDSPPDLEDILNKYPSKDLLTELYFELINSELIFRPDRDWINIMRNSKGKEYWCADPIDFTKYWCIDPIDLKKLDLAKKLIPHINLNDNLILKTYFSIKCQPELLKLLIEEYNDKMTQTTRWFMVNELSHRRGYIEIADMLFEDSVFSSLIKKD